MIYNDGVQTNDDMRVEFCPRCENEIISTHAEYCKICSLRLYNYCTGETKSDPNGHYPDIIEEHKNASDARYCEKCGEPTIYGKENLLKTWKQIETEAEEENEYDRIPF